MIRATPEVFAIGQAWQAAASWGELLLRKKLCGMSRIAAGCQGALISTPKAARFSTIVTRANIYIPIVSPIAVCIAKCKPAKRIGSSFRTACPPVCGKCGLAKNLGVGSASLFDQRSSAQKRREDACALQKSRDGGTKHNGQNLRKLATASSSCGELRKLSSIAPITAEQQLLHPGLPARASFV